MRYYIGVDWAEEAHAARVEDEQGQRVSAGRVPHSPVGFSEWGRQLDEWRAQGIVLWAAIERPEGRVVDCLLDHGVRVYPVNPKALDRARDRFRQSGAKRELFDALVLGGFLRTDHAHLMVLEPSSEAAQGAQAADRGLSAPGAHANAAGESADSDAEGLLSAGVGRGGADDGPRARLPAGVSDPGDADDADRAAVAAVGEGASPERGADHGAVDEVAAAATAGAPACGPRQESADAGPRQGIGRGRGGGGQLSTGDRRFSRDHAGGGAGADAAGR